MAERGRLLSRSARSGEYTPAERGTVPRGGVRRPPGGALPSRPRKSNCAPSRPAECGRTACALRPCATHADKPWVATAPPLCGRRAAPGLEACVVSGAVGAHARTLCSMSTAEAMCGARVETCCGDTGRCAVSRAALSAASAAVSPTDELSRSERSSAGGVTARSALAQFGRAPGAWGVGRGVGIIRRARGLRVVAPYIIWHLQRWSHCR